MILLKVNIEYGENIIIAVIFKKNWSWYVTEKDYWFLDLVKLENAYLNKGYQLHDQGDYSDRFNIAVLDENSVENFLDEISEFQVSKDELKEIILMTDGTNTGVENYLLQYMPALLVDFDNRILSSNFPEPASFECYVPDGWIGKYEDFLDKVSIEEKYWLINSRDYFSKK